MANNHGGARAGAGRKRNSDRYREAIETFTDGAAGHLPQVLENITLLADGGFEQVTETWEPAGLIEREEVDFDSDGKAVRRKVLVFPDKPADELVLVRKVTSIAAPDRKANEYLVDRVMGRPTQAIDIDGDPDGTLEQTADTMAQAARELTEWRKSMTEQLSSLNAPPTPPTAATTTE